jgi:hypothetical protein
VDAREPGRLSNVVIVEEQDRIGMLKHAAPS